MILTDKDMLQKLEQAFPGVYTDKIREIERFAHWQELRGKRKKRGHEIRMPQYRSMFSRLIGGKWKVTNSDDWDWERPFGKCPACGAWGVEEIPCCESATANFRCSDDSCYTHYTEPIPDGIQGERQRAHWSQCNLGIKATKWADTKPDFWLQIQDGGSVYSWNWAKFSVAYCEKLDLV